MDQEEIKKLLVEASKKSLGDFARRDEIYEEIFLPALRKKFDRDDRSMSLDLLPGITSLMSRIYYESLAHNPSSLPSFLPVFVMILSEPSPAEDSVFGEVDWNNLTIWPNAALFA